MPETGCLLGRRDKRAGSQEAQEQGEPSPLALRLCHCVPWKTAMELQVLTFVMWCVYLVCPDSSLPFPIHPFSNENM